MNGLPFLANLSVVKRRIFSCFFFFVLAVAAALPLSAAPLKIAFLCAQPSLEKEGEAAHSPASDKAWRWFERNFVDIVSFIKNDGVLPVLISQSSVIHDETIDDKEVRLVIRNDFQGMTTPRLLLNWKQASKTIEDVAKRHNVPFVDGYNAVRPLVSGWKLETERGSWSSG